MRILTKSCFLGLSLLLAACSGADSEAAADAPAAEATSPAPTTAASSAVSPEAVSPEAEPAMPDPEVGAEPAADAGAPVEAGSGSSSSGGMQIPMPSSGKLHASAKTGDLCQFSVDGYAKGSSTTLDIALYTGTHVVACKRADGKVASEAVTIVANTTTTTVLEFPVDLTNGTLVAVAVGGTCTFSVNGAAKGTSSQLKLSVPPGTYSVTCKPAAGATKSRSVIIKPGESAMAMFNLG